MTTPTFRDVEQISALLDGQLPQAEAARLQLLIASNPELASVYKQLNQTRVLLRRLPARRAPRNFTLTPQMAGIKAPTPRAFPVFRFASVLASLLLLLTFAANAFGAIASTSMAAAPVAAPAEAYGKGGGPITEDTVNPQSQSAGGNGNAEPAATQAPAAAAPAATEAPAATMEAPVLAAPALTATPEALRTFAEATAEPTVEAAAPKQGAAIAPPEQTPAAAPQPALMIPVWLQIGLLVMALLAGGAAWFVNWKANADFSRKSRK